MLIICIIKIMEDEMDKSIVKKVIMTLITILVIVYVIYVIFNAGIKRIKTETVQSITVSDSINVTGYFIRNEKAIEYNGKGVVSYTVQDGDKVSKNETVANIFESDNDATAKQEIEELQAQIDALEQLEKSADIITVTPDDIDKNINSLLMQANINVSNGDYSLVDENISDTLYNLNERQLVTGKITDFQKKITELKSKINTLQKSSSGAKKNTPIKSASSGYFVSSVDGYEGIYTSKDIENIYPEDMADGKIQPKEIEENVIGKTIEGVYWYIAVPVTAEQALNLKRADYLTIDLPLALNKNIDVTLVSLNQKNKTSDAVAILRGEYMTAEMANIRNENVVININSYNGIYVSKKAIHEIEVTKTITDEKGKEKEVTEAVAGVYVSFGNMLTFKQIVPIYSGDDYVICKESPEDEERFSEDLDVLQVYDKVVVEGADLYDGKLIR